MIEGLTYIQAGEVLIPALTMEEETEDIGKYGSMREKYIREHLSIFNYITALEMLSEFWSL